MEGCGNSPRVQNTAEKILEGQGLSAAGWPHTEHIPQKPCKAWFGQGLTVLMSWDSACVNTLLPVLLPPGEGRATQADGRMTVRKEPSVLQPGGGSLDGVLVLFSHF